MFLCTRTWSMLMALTPSVHSLTIINTKHTSWYTQSLMSLLATDTCAYAFFAYYQPAQMTCITTSHIHHDVKHSYSCHPKCLQSNTQQHWTHSLVQSRPSIFCDRDHCIYIPLALLFLRQNTFDSYIDSALK